MPSLEACLWLKLFGTTVWKTCGVPAMNRPLFSSPRHVQPTRRAATRPSSKRVLAGLLIAVWATAGSHPLYGQPSEGESLKGRQWAALVGIEKYERANPLQYTINDVRRVGETLRTRGGYEPECILEITDDAADPRRQPKREAIMAELAAWLKKPTKDDRIVVYFSGHGFRADDGTMYLAPIDVDPANPAATGIPVAWFRDQIAACQAGFKLLVLDACHAGSEKGEGDANLDEKDLNIFRELQKVVTLASSTADQKSQIWSEKEQSLFSYWLNEGLKGHADDDADGTVDIDELNKYVYRNVTHTAKVRFDRKQTPVRHHPLGHARHAGRAEAGPAEAQAGAGRHGPAVGRYDRGEKVCKSRRARVHQRN